MSKELIIEFAAYLRQVNRSDSTIVAYTKDLDQLIAYSQIAVQDLDTTSLETVIKKLNSDFKFTPKTLSRKLNSFRMFYKFLQSKGRVTLNPAERIDHPRFTPKQPRVLSHLEYLALQQVASTNHRLSMMVELMLQTGIRIGELSRAQIGDLKLDSHKPYLYVSEYSTNPAREVPLNPTVAKKIQDYVGSLPERFGPNTPLFHTREGKAIIIRNIRSSVDRAMQKAGIEDACVNDLRNTFIVAQLEAGAAIDYVSRIVGHRSRVTTNKYLSLLQKPYKPTGRAEVVEL